MAIIYMKKRSSRRKWHWVFICMYTRARARAHTHL